MNMNRMLSAAGGFYPSSVPIEQAAMLLHDRSPVSVSQHGGFPGSNTAQHHLGQPTSAALDYAAASAAARHAAAAAAGQQMQLPSSFLSSAAFHPLLAAAAAGHFNPYASPDGYPGGMDFNMITRRKNATRETTSALKAWLNEHKKNPYPTKGEKIMLAIITKMTLTQVSTWFANARRRLKKENKMTWAAGSGGDKEDGDTCFSDDDDDDDKCLDDYDDEETANKESGIEDNDDYTTMWSPRTSDDKTTRCSSAQPPRCQSPNEPTSPSSRSESEVNNNFSSICNRQTSSNKRESLTRPLSIHTKEHFPLNLANSSKQSVSPVKISSPQPTRKPSKIWSLADTAMSPTEIKSPIKSAVITNTQNPWISTATPPRKLHEYFQDTFEASTVPQMKSEPSVSFFNSPAVRSYLPPHYAAAMQFQNSVFNFNHNLPKSF